MIRFSRRVTPGKGSCKYIKGLTEDIKKLLEEEKLMPTK